MAIGRRWRLTVERAWWTTALTAWQIAMWPLAGLYRLLWFLRSMAYRQRWFRTHHAPVPVVVVGNLIVGGAGKTPCVIALAQALAAQGWHPGIISRGHGSSHITPRAVRVGTTAASVGDEPLLIQRRTGMPVWVGHDRVATTLALCQSHPDVDILIADDGLQHTALHRDAQLVIFDERGAGNGALLPAGPLREPMWERVPPGSIVLYNADRPTTPLPGHLLTRRLGRLLPLKAWWTNDDSAAIELPSLMGRPLLAAAGIGHPERFFTLLQQSGLHFDRLALPDHAVLDPRPWPLDVPCVIVTEKDAVKLSPDAPDAHSIVVAALDLDLPFAVLDNVAELLPRPPRA